MRILKTVFRLGSADFTNKWKNWSQPEIIAEDKLFVTIDFNQLILSFVCTLLKRSVTHKIIHYFRLTVWEKLKNKNKKLNKIKTYFIEQTAVIAYQVVIIKDRTHESIN